MQFVLKLKPPHLRNFSTTSLRILTNSVSSLLFFLKLVYNQIMGKYDNAYKYLFKNKRIFYQLITSFVKEDFVKEITLENIELVDKSFVSEEFLARESDVIYKINLKTRQVYIFILLEFQSTVDKTIPVRMFSYLFQFYDLLQRDSQKGKLPSIFPLLLYSGLEDWTIPTNIKDLIDHQIPEKYIPNFEYYTQLFRVCHFLSLIKYL